MQQFSKEYGINYPLAVAGPEVIELTRQLGNRAGGLPYTLVLDANGKLRGAHLGGMSEGALDRLLAPVAQIPPS